MKQNCLDTWVKYESLLELGSIKKAWTIKSRVCVVKDQHKRWLQYKREKKRGLIRMPDLNKLCF